MTHRYRIVRITVMFLQLHTLENCIFSQLFSCSDLNLIYRIFYFEKEIDIVLLKRKQFLLQVFWLENAKKFDKKYAHIHYYDKV